MQQLVSFISAMLLWGLASQCYAMLGSQSGCDRVTETEGTIACEATDELVVVLAKPKIDRSEVLKVRVFQYSPATDSYPLVFEDIIGRGASTMRYDGEERSLVIADLNQDGYQEIIVAFYAAQKHLKTYWLHDVEKERFRLLSFVNSQTGYSKNHLTAPRSASLELDRGVHVVYADGTRQHYQPAKYGFVAGESILDGLSLEQRRQMAREGKGDLKTWAAYLEASIHREAVMGNDAAVAQLESDLALVRQADLWRFSKDLLNQSIRTRLIKKSTGAIPIETSDTASALMMLVLHGKPGRSSLAALYFAMLQHLESDENALAMAYFTAEEQGTPEDTLEDFRKLFKRHYQVTRQANSLAALAAVTSDEYMRVSPLPYLAFNQTDKAREIAGYSQTN